MENGSKGTNVNLKEHLWKRRAQLIQKNDTAFWKKADFYWPITARIMLNMSRKYDKYEANQNEPNYYYTNFKTIVVNSPRRPAVAAASRSPAEGEASPLSSRNCMPPSPLPPAVWPIGRGARNR